MAVTADGVVDRRCVRSNLEQLGPFSGKKETQVVASFMAYFYWLCAGLCEQARLLPLQALVELDAQVRG